MNGDTIASADLQPSIDLLKKTADDLNPLIAASIDLADAQALGQAQQNLLGTAGSRRGRPGQLARRTGEDADHINDAVAYPNGVIAAVANWRQRLAKIGSLLDFLSIVFTGNELSWCSLSGLFVSAATISRHARQ